MSFERDVDDPIRIMQEVHHIAMQKQWTIVNRCDYFLNKKSINMQ